MSSSLRAKLALMRSGVAPERAGARPGLAVRRSSTAQDAPFAGVPDRAALARIGFDAPWPGIERLLFLDTETTGLAGGAGTLAFLVGLGYYADGAFTTEQLLLGDYADEPELIARMLERMRAFDVVVTFNGNAFDLPLLESRLTLLRVPGGLPGLARLDLLPPSRRLWKKRLGSVRLSMLEEKVLRCGRTDDLPGSEAPKRFFEALKTGDRTRLEPVIEHNRLDVCAMPRLLGQLLGDYANPAAQKEPLDLISMGRLLEKRGERGEAVKCYHMASLPRAVSTVADLRGRRAAGEALYALGLIHKRMGEYARAARAWEAAVSRGQMGALPMVELAKVCEHRTRDLDAALGWTLCALATAGDAQLQAALEKRKARLENKIARRGAERIRRT
ncbi:MAG: ribonuclease H-like domain-containing protein [Clostridia bacterium]